MLRDTVLTAFKVPAPSNWIELLEERLSTLRALSPARQPERRHEARV
jgi:hypothetical protein